MTRAHRYTPRIAVRRIILPAVALLSLSFLGISVNGQNPDREAYREQLLKRLLEAKKGDFSDEQLANGKSFVNSIGMKFRRIDPGTFTMGSKAEEAGRLSREFQHEVEITKPFYIGIYEVTQAQYTAITGENSFYFTSIGGGRTLVRGLNTKDFPAERISWEQAMAFCVKLADAERAKGAVYDLPTEAEWEYACRADSESAFHVGQSLTAAQANFRPSEPAEGEAPAKSAPLERVVKVGSYGANGWGLYDMHGNVAEWCKDWYEKDYYRKSPAKDPQGPEMGTTHVIRGGSWNDSEDLCRSAYHGEGPNGGRYYVGFRAVKRIKS